MNVFCPFVARFLRPETRRTLDGIAKFIELPEGDFHAYRRFFIERWNEGATFINVEHDVAPTVTQLQSLWNCSQPWCGFGYWPADRRPWFGCVKFSAAFIASHRGIWTDHENEYDYWWGSLDAHLWRESTCAFHLHEPAVWHHRNRLTPSGGNIIPPISWA